MHFVAESSSSVGPKPSGTKRDKHSPERYGSGEFAKNLMNCGTFSSQRA